jgi:putative PEP-CTERM system TPR-repeat lipoprotein
MANNDKRAASQSLRKALEIKPDQLDAQRRLIKLDVDARNYDDAVKIARTVQQQRPKSPAGFVFEGDIANVQEKWDAAARAYRAALQYGSASEIATKLHAVLLASGKSAEAGSFGSTWLREHPKDAVFMAYQGEQALAKKDYAAAERHYLAALNIQPNNALVLNNLAWVTGRLGKDGAVDLAEKANKLAPNQPALMDTLAMLLADKNEFSRALEWQNKAVGLQPSNAELRLNLAKIYIKSGDRVRAKAELETLVNLGSKSSTHAEVIELLQTL